MNKSNYDSHVKAFLNYTKKESALSAELAIKLLNKSTYLAEQSILIDSAADALKYLNIPRYREVTVAGGFYNQDIIRKDGLIYEVDVIRSKYIRSYINSNLNGDVRRLPHKEVTNHNYKSCPPTRLYNPVEIMKIIDIKLV